MFLEGVVLSRWLILESKFEINSIELELAQLDEDVTFFVVECGDLGLLGGAVDGPTAAEGSVHVVIQGHSTCPDSLRLLQLTDEP